tara:strand:+ start:316 stop:735 length:420 start_codon:yes stop_codon:yes gene_type:complete
MPYDVIKRSCRQSDGSKGTHVVVKKKSGGKTEQVSCHTSEAKAKSAVRAKHANEGNVMKITKKQLKRIIAEESAKLSENSVRVMADSGPVTMSANLNRDGTNTVTVRFDNSYTLRLDEQGLESMRNMIHQALLDVIAAK